MLLLLGSRIRLWNERTEPHLCVFIVCLCPCQSTVSSIDLSAAYIIKKALLGHGGCLSNVSGIVLDILFKKDILSKLIYLNCRKWSLPLIKSGFHLQKVGGISYFKILNVGTLIPILSLECFRGPLPGFIQKYLPNLDATDISFLKSHSSVLSIALMPSSFWVFIFLCQLTAQVIKNIG